MTPPRRSDFSFFFRLPTRWADMDSLGHVNNTKFFTYDESARLEYFRRLMSGDAKFFQNGPSNDGWTPPGRGGRGGRGGDDAGLENLGTEGAGAAKGKGKGKQ